MLLSTAANAQPFKPDSPTDIIARFPSGTPRGSLQAAPTRDPDIAAVLATSYIQRARQASDPRFLGYAEGVLQPWWSLAQPPPQILLLRATLLQSRHQFDRALTDIGKLLSAEPNNVQAWLTQATILRVQGNFESALAACTHIEGRVSITVSTLCRTSIESLTGQLQASAKTLDELAPRIASEPASVRGWFFAERAAMAERLGNIPAATYFYQHAVDTHVADPLLIAAYADHLIAAHQPREALQLTGAHPTAEVLRLRAAIAERILQKLDPVLIAELDDAFTLSRQRGEDIHLREQAMFELDVRDDPATALRLALQNWRKQREPADLRVLLAAAHRAGNTDSVRPALEWMRNYGFEDARLQSLIVADDH